MKQIEIAGATYVTPTWASKKFAINRATLYWWFRTKQVELLPLDLAENLQRQGIIRGKRLIKLDSLIAKFSESHLEVKK